MPNGDSINDRLEYKERIKKLSPEGRLLETALMVYDLKLTVSECLDPRAPRKAGAVSGSVTGAIVAIVIGIAEWFVRK